MISPFVSRAGGVLSADIAVPVPEHERAMRFYSRVLGTGTDPLWRAEDLMNNLGLPVIGLGARTPEHTELPVQWMPHIQVADVGASAARAASLGGRVLLDATGDDGTCQWAALVDPNGAAFGVIPRVPDGAIPPHAADASGPVGHIAWLDLTVSDAAATRDFYRQVVGWSAEDVPMRDGDRRYADYNMLAEDGAPAAGVCHARGVNAGLPPVWMLYLMVGDLAESLRRVPEEGGEVVRAVQGAGGAYVYAAVRDPAGALFALVPAPRTDP